MGIQMIKPNLTRRIYKSLSGKGFGTAPIISTISSFFIKYYYRLTIKSKGKVILTEYEDIKIYVPTDDEIIGTSIILTGLWEKYVTNLFKKFIKPGMNVMDIGASYGYFSLISAKLVGPEGNVFAFEPEPSQYDLLVQSMNLNDFNNIKPFKIALSNKSGKSIAYLRKNIPEEVETITLDEFYNSKILDHKIDFVKIDVDGSEGSIIEKSDVFLTNNNPRIILEFWPLGIKHMNGDPFKTISKFISYNYTIKLIDEHNHSIKSMDEKDIQRMCKDKSDVYMLLLEK